MITCKYCGGESPNEYSFDSDHWPMPLSAAQWGQALCVTQELMLNHCIAYLNTAAGVWGASICGCDGSRKHDVRACAMEAFEREVDLLAARRIDARHMLGLDGLSLKQSVMAWMARGGHRHGGLPRESAQEVL